MTMGRSVDPSRFTTVPVIHRAAWGTAVDRRWEYRRAEVT